METKTFLVVDDEIGAGAGEDLCDAGAREFHDHRSEHRFAAREFFAHRIAAHHRIPLLSVMLNNRGYHQEIMHVQRMCNQRNRGIDRGTMGSTLLDPNIDFAKVAQGLGLHAEGPITDPRDLGPALRRAAETVRRGEPALVDVVIQPR